MRLLVLLPTFIGSPISVIFITGQLYWLLFLHGFKFAASIMKPFWAWRPVILYNHYKTIIRSLSEISNRHRRSVDRNDPLVPLSGKFKSLNHALASADPLCGIVFLHKSLLIFNLAHLLLRLSFLSPFFPLEPIDNCISLLRVPPYIHVSMYIEKNRNI